ncbi:MAG TPA: thiolase [Actinobacteria bacterium]|nr:thiolase [Actinomycetota bacterium]HCK78946.1 thiolase [Actinomycetota bacterium]
MSDRRAVIVGASECDLGDTGLSVLHLQTQAVTRALADAGLSLGDVDGLACTSVARFSATQLADYLGIEPVWTDSTFAGGAAFEMFVARAAQAIEAGQAEVVVISFASNQRSARSRSLGNLFEPHTPEAQFEGPYGPLYPLSHYAMAAQRYLHITGAGREHLAEVAVAARQWALLNPAAFRHGAGPLTVDAVLESPLISSPLSAADCCLVTDGGGAIVLTTAERARDLPGAPIHILGYGESTSHTSMATPEDLVTTGAQVSGAIALHKAGLAPAEIDVVQIYDSFTITVLLSLEALGFCARGEAWQFVQNGRIAPGGDFALNTSGGGLSYCHPGQFGVLLLVEAVRQLRGECAERQVSGARTALAHGTGGILSTSATVVLGVDR